jgi:hypothetical protein
MYCVSGAVTNRMAVNINKTRPIQANARPAHVNTVGFGWFVLEVQFNRPSPVLTRRPFLGLRFYSLNGTPNDSSAVWAGRCCVPTIFGCLPMSFQMRSAVAFIYSIRTSSRLLPRRL